MADGAHLELDAKTAEQLQAAADAAGLSPAAYVAFLVRGPSEGLAEDQARWARFEQDGVAYDAEPVLEEFQRRVAEEVAKRA